MKLLLSIILAIGVIGGGLWLFLDQSEPPTESVTQPTSTSTPASADTPSEFLDWTATSTETLSFRYPTFTHTYVSAVAWPPVIEQRSETPNCDGGEGSEVKVAEFEGVRYCVKTTSEGAAGSIYKTYEYKREGYQATVTLRFPQCFNYDQQQQDACVEEQKNLNVDSLVNKILSTVTHT